MRVKQSKICVYSRSHDVYSMEKREYRCVFIGLHQAKVADGDPRGIINHFELNNRLFRLGLTNLLRLPALITGKDHRLRELQPANGVP